MSDFITSALWNWFLGWPWYAHVALAAGAVLFAWGALNGLFTLASKIGGWKAGLGAMLAVAGLVAFAEAQAGRLRPACHLSHLGRQPAECHARSVAVPMLRLQARQPSSVLDWVRPHIEGLRIRRRPPRTVSGGFAATRRPQQADRRPRRHGPGLPGQHVLRRAIHVQPCSQPARQRRLQARTQR